MAYQTTIDSGPQQPARLSQINIARLYTWLAPSYDFWTHFMEARALRRALALADVRDGQHILEVAVGTGRIFTQLVGANPHGRNVGFDLTPRMLAKATRRLARAGHTNFELSQGDAHAIREADDSFDLVMNNYMFDLIDEADWLKILREFHRVLKPGGKLVLVNMALTESLGSRIFEALYRLSPWLMGGCRGVRMSAPVKDAGFAVEVDELSVQGGFPSSLILARKPERSL